MKNIKFLPFVLIMCIFSSCLFSPKNSKSGTLEAVGFLFSDTNDWGYLFNNEDGQIDPGEKIYMDIAVHNKSMFNSMKDVTVSISTDSDYIEIVKDEAFYGTIDMEKYQNFHGSKSYYPTGSSDVSSLSLDASYYSDEDDGIPFSFIIKKPCPRGTKIEFTVTMTPAKKDPYESTLTVEVRPAGPIDKKFWGTWIQMDTGREYYIDSYAVYSVVRYSSGGVDKTLIQDNTTDYSLDTEYVMRKGDVVFFKKGGKNRSFSAGLSGFSGTLGNIRAARLDGSQLVEGYRQNTQNPDDNETGELNTASDSITFEGGLAEDTQSVTITAGDETSEVEVNPTYDGENIGTIPLVEKNSYAFKTTYDINSDAQNFLFVNTKDAYKLDIIMNNIGEKDCGAAYYEISCDDPNLSLTKSSKNDLTGNFSTVEAGKSTTVQVLVKYTKAIEDEYVDVPIKIEISDRYNPNPWEDSVTLRFYRGTVPLVVKAECPTGSSGELKGFVIYPDGRSMNFSVYNRSEETIYIPWSKSDYVLAFSGASATSEMKYTFAFASTSSILPDISSAYTIDELKMYTRNTAKNPYSVENHIPVKAYIGKGDVQFFTINNKNVGPGFPPFYVIDYKVQDVLGTDNGVVNPGDILYMDIMTKSNTSETISGKIKGTVSCDDSSITIYQNTFEMPYNSSYKYYSITHGSPGYASSNVALLKTGFDTSKVLKFEIPSGYTKSQIIFKVRFTLSDGRYSESYFSVPVQK